MDQPMGPDSLWPPGTASLALLSCLLLALSSLLAAQETPLLTRWGEQLDRARVHAEHPRPQFRRPNWLSLNGEWNYAIQAPLAAAPEVWDGRILVPFPVESVLSGVRRRVGADQVLRYRRSFRLPRGVRAEQLKARHVNGVLTVTIPARSPEDVSRRVPIQISVGSEASEPRTVVESA